MTIPEDKATNSIVLATVNAPYSNKIDAETLANIISNPEAARLHAGPMSSFFYDVQPNLQIKFANAHQISTKKLKLAAKLFDRWSGMRSPLLGDDER